ncbi:lytic transglycosylase domain-containing protein [Orlajensenia flava]|uniref:aggregation-promoting factor C-terminal-like domain-containing protein n=1 Tax=Orlajensenia flava TaxID=2565934 RepID=UPI001A9BB629|nr:lytic transglycosylase domain-containing protein [Glaciibacter flavus]
MGRHSGAVAPYRAAVAIPDRPVRVPAKKAASRSRAVLFLFAFAASAAFVLVNVVDPYSGATASPYFHVVGSYSSAEVQALSVPARVDAAIQRDGYDVKAKPTPPPAPAEPASASSSGRAPAAGTPDPGSAKAIALDLVHARGWGDDEYSCLVALWNRESGWNVYASNPSGAYGIPQALPGSKMSSAGSDWESDAATQITWGLGYITGRYGSPCGAWAHSEDAGWY